jgi:hypothetical protein
MRKPTVRLLALIALPFIAFGAIACSDDDDTTPSDVSTAVGQAGGAESELCTSLEDFDAAVSDAQGLDANSTVDEAEQAQEDVTSAWEQVQDAAGDVAAAALNALETAQQALQDALDNVSGSDTIGAAADEISSQTEQIDEALTGLKTQSGCP